VSLAASAARGAEGTVWNVTNMLPQIGPDTRFDDEVVVWAAQNKGTTWHADKACPRFARHLRAPVEVWTTAGRAATMLWDIRSSTPCVSCARPGQLDLAVRAAAAEPAKACRLVLGCVRLRFAQGGSHERCPSCVELRAFAARHDLTTYATRYSYQLVAADLHREMRFFAQRAFAAHWVPDAVPAVTAELLRAAWALRSRHGLDETLELPASKLRESGVYVPLSELAFTAADLITAPPAPQP
jgi:hypothetical protein